jgi:hypothetical protein
MYFAAGDAKNTAASPMSSGSPQRPAGIRSRIALLRRLVADQGLGVVGRDIARRNRVHIDALGRPFIGQKLGDARNPVLRSRVGRNPDPALKRQKRRDVDDGPVPPRAKAALPKAWQVKNTAFRFTSRPRPSRSR